MGRLEQPVDHLDLLGILQDAAQELQAHVEGHDPLHRVVVNIAGDARSLLLLRGHDVLQESAPVLVHLLELVDHGLQLPGLLGDLGLEPEVLRHDAVLQSLDLRELFPDGLHEPRAVERHRGMCRELLDHADHPRLDLVALGVLQGHDPQPIAAVREHRHNEDVLRVGEEPGQPRVVGRIECGDGHYLPRRPRPLHHGVESRLERLGTIDAEVPEELEVILGRGEQDSTREPEVEMEPVKQRPGDLLGGRHAVDIGDPLGQMLEVDLLRPEIPFVLCRERGGGECDQPHPAHPEDDDDALDRSAADPVGDLLPARRDDPAPSGLEQQEIQQRVPEGDLQPRSIRGRERDGDDVHVHEDPERTLGAAGLQHHPREEEAVHQE